MVKVIDGSAEFKRSRGGKLLLRIRITAEVDGVRSDYEITYSRRGAGNAAKGSATAKADAPGGRETDAKRFSTLMEALIWEETEGVPQKQRHHRDRVRQGTSRRLRPLRRACRRHREVARGNGPVSPAHRPGAEREHFVNLKSRPKQVTRRNPLPRRQVVAESER